MNWIEEQIAKLALKRARRQLEMTGWKTKAAGVGAIASGVGLVIAGVVGETFNFDTVKQGVAAIIAGLSILGIGHKIEKAAPSK